jgi:hypothetical protein
MSGIASVQYRRENYQLLRWMMAFVADDALTFGSIPTFCSLESLQIEPWVASFEHRGARTLSYVKSLVDWLVLIHLLVCSSKHIHI